MTIRDRINDAVREYITIPEDIRRLMGQANYSLYYGPDVPEEDWPGWSEAIDKLSDWADDAIPGELFVDEDSEYVMTDEPEGEYIDPETGEHCEDPDNTPGSFWADPPPYYKLDRLDIERIIFGRELASYI